jgi:hypothetical protein
MTRRVVALLAACAVFGYSLAGAQAPAPRRSAKVPKAPRWRGTDSLPVCTGAIVFRVTEDSIGVEVQMRRPAAPCVLDVRD